MFVVEILWWLGRHPEGNALTASWSCCQHRARVVPHRFSLQPSCHLKVVPLSPFSLLSLHPLSRRSPLPRSATPPPPPCRSLALATSLASRRRSALLGPRGVLWREIFENQQDLEFIKLSSRKDDSSDTHSDHLPPSQVVAQVHSRFGHLHLHRWCWHWGPLRVHRYQHLTSQKRSFVLKCTAARLVQARVDLSNADVLGSGWMENPKDEDGHYRLSWRARLIPFHCGTARVTKP